MNREYYEAKFFQDYNPNPVFAEISTGNWVYALANTIKLVHGNGPIEWRTSISNAFERIQNVNDFPLIHRSMRALSQGLSLTLSLEARKENFTPWHTVGLISDFYYSITNIFDVIIMGQVDSTYEDHTTRIRHFDGLRSLFPHPFDMISSFYDGSGWRNTLLVSKEHFRFEFPSLDYRTTNSSEGLINEWHDSINTSLAKDILLGYLRGTTGFLWEMKCNLVLWPVLT